MPRKLLVLNLLIWCQFLYLNTVFAQNKNYIFSYYNQEQRLVSSTISGVLKDKQGFIWLFSENGIGRFDGYSFKNISSEITSPPPSPIRLKAYAQSKETNTILFITQDYIASILPGKTKFAITQKLDPVGSSCYFIEDENNFIIHNTNAKKIIVFNSLGTLINTIDISQWPPSKIGKETINEQLVIQQKKQVVFYNYRTNKKTIYPVKSESPLDKIPKIFPSTYKNLSKCIVLNEEIYDYNLKNNQFSESQQAEDIQAQIRAASQIIASGDSIYYLRNKNSIILFKRGLPHPINLITDNSHYKGIKLIAKGMHGNLWVICEDEKMLEYDHRLNKIITVDLPLAGSGLSITNNLESIYTDGEVTWLTSPGNGLIKMEYRASMFTPYNPYQDFKSISDKSPYKLNIRTICEWQANNMLIGSLDGLLAFDNLKRKFVEPNFPTEIKKELSNLPISAILKDPEGDLWISGWHELKLICISSTTKKGQVIFAQKDASIIEGTIRSMFFDNQNNLWLGTPDNKIYKCDWHKLKKGIANPAEAILGFKPNNGDIPNFGITFNFSQPDPLRLLIACENGLIEYNYLQKKLSKKLKPKNNSIKITNIRCILNEGNGWLWLGSNGMGLIHYNYLTDSLKITNASDGLGDNYIYSIQYGKKNEIWMGTNNGLNIYNCVTNKFQRYSSIDGLQSAEFNTNASLKTSNNFLVFGGVSGINYFNPNTTLFPSFNNPIYITSIWNNGKEIPSNLNKLDLNYFDNNLKIEFAALGYLRNNEYQYAYQLEGLSSEWITCGTQREANFLKIPPGEYVFRVKVADCYGNWTYLATPLLINIKTPWFKTWWFYLIIIILVALIITLIIRSKLGQYKEMEEMRNSIAKDLHDEVGANLSNITLFLAIINQKLDSENTEAKRLLSKISNFTQSSQDAMSDIVWMINVKNDEFDNLSIKMKDYASSLSEDIPVNISFHVDPALSRQKMGMIQRKNIYLFYKEAINNALKYANASKLEIQANYKQKMLYLEIRDNGIGFDESTIKQGNGLKNMRKRAEQLNGKVNIRSKISEGTSITLICPCSNH